MTYLLLLIAAFAATTQMTIFSYVIAKVFNQPYDEPFLLALLLNRLNVNNSTINRYVGWVLHYALGLVFVIGFQLLVNIGWMGITWISALIYGVVIGIIGISGWQFMFKLCQKQPKMDCVGFYIQLFFAHILFSFVMVLCYKTVLFQ